MLIAKIRKEKGKRKVSIYKLFCESIVFYANDFIMNYFLDETAYQQIRSLIELSSEMDKLGQKNDLYFLLGAKHISKSTVIAKLYSSKGWIKWLLLFVYCKNPLQLYLKMLLYIYKGIKNALSEEFWHKEVRSYLKYKPKVEKKRFTYLYN